MAKLYFPKVGQTRLEGIREMARDQGVRGLWFATMAKLGYRRVLMREYVLAEGIAEVTPGVPVVIEQLQRDQVDEFNAFRAPADPQSAAQRLASGHRCFVARYEGTIVCSGWVATGHAWSEYLSATISIAPDDFYMYGVYTRPEFRGKGIAEALRAETCRFYRSQGFRRVVTYVVPENRRALSRLGFHTIGIVGCIRIGSFRRDFVRMRSR
jgi:ribosomal protein S18 acetylase RimI-like enzyme